ncbi:hypothetical protein AHAS_Ahas15G0196900 [Arachis hypogaea]
MHCLTYDYDALRSVVAQPDTPWKMDANKLKPKGMRFEYLRKEAKHLIEHMDRSERRHQQRFERLSQMLASLGAVMPSDSDTSSDQSKAEEEDREEEARQAEAPP